MMEEKRQEKHYQDINSSSHQESSQGTSLNSSALKVRFKEMHFLQELTASWK